MLLPCSASKRSSKYLYKFDDDNAAAVVVSHHRHHHRRHRRTVYYDDINENKNLPDELLSVDDVIKMTTPTYEL